ncbi:DNA-processing protein DprA [Bacillus smithii]|uniref:DNA-processing protein DprA n=1 Tax=Bacillus smithii TaxID=1479 RepID=UPI0030C92CEC
MDELSKKLFHLSHCPSMTWNRIFRLLKADPSLKHIYSYSARHFSDVLSIPLEKSLQIYQEIHSFDIHQSLNIYNRYQIKFFPIYDSNYPRLLKQIPTPPWGLYAAGDSRLLSDEKKIAFVGSRKGNDYGKKVISEFIPPLVEEKFIIVSGLASGIDSFSHQAALQAGGKTIAVLGGGFFHLYPKENAPLAKLIAEKGLLISEYPPNRKPKKWHFPERNRIISGMTIGTVVIQAGKRSGSLITVQHALEQGKEVFAVPGAIFDPLSEGTHDLLADGAHLVRNAEDIIKVF